VAEVVFGSHTDSYHGVEKIFEYRNADGNQKKYNCGQAAACTYLMHNGVFSNLVDPLASQAIMAEVEHRHPPDNFGGWLGTSRRRVERICRAYGKPVEPLFGEIELRERLALMTPVIVMMGVERHTMFGWRVPAGHWMVAFGYDEQRIYLTNGRTQGMLWDEFRYGWGSLIPRFVSMRNIGLSTQGPIAGLRKISQSID
jgi:hypothetical protein